MTLLLTDDERKQAVESNRADGDGVAGSLPLPFGAWETTTETISRRLADRPITFDEFVRLPNENGADKEKHIELIDGVLTERMAAQIEHEWLQNWLLRLMADYAEARDLGMVLGSRTAVRVTEFRGRLPDLLFVRKERVSEIVRREGMYGPPDLIIELASPNGYGPHLLAIEADYRTFGVREIVIINQGRGTVRVLRRGAVANADDAAESAPYDEQNMSLTDDAEAVLTLETLPGFSVSLADLFANPLPPKAPVLARLLADNPTA